jgi:hypothetical protein
VYAGSCISDNVLLGGDVILIVNVVSPEFDAVEGITDAYNAVG